MKTKVKTAIIMASLVIMTYGAIADIKYTRNLFYFLTGFHVVCLIAIAGPTYRRKIIASYRDPNSGGHMPGWVDYLFYVAIIIPLAAHTFYWCAAAWTLIAMVDGALRDESKKQDTIRMPLPKVVPPHNN